MKQQFSILLHLLILLALGACGIVPASPSPTPSATVSSQPSRVPDPVEEVGSCSSEDAVTPDVVDTGSPPPEAASIMPLSCNEIGEVFAYDPQEPLDIQEVGRWRQLSVTIINLTYASPMGGRVPATLVVPDGAGPFAGMLYQHGIPRAPQPIVSVTPMAARVPATLVARLPATLVVPKRAELLRTGLLPGKPYASPLYQLLMSGARRMMINFAVTYARMGTVVLLIDAPFARRLNGMDAPVTMTEQDRREQIQLIVDLRRGIDLLLSRPEVDPERLAYVGDGYYGGAMGGLLAGVEHRLEAYVLQYGDGGLVTHYTGPEDRAVWLAKPEDQRRQWVAWMWPIEPIHYVGCASPAALLFQNGTRDAEVPAADAWRFQEAGSEPKTACWYRLGNMFNPPAIQDATEWLSKRIGISYGQLAVQVDPEVLAEYAGRYQSADGWAYTIRVDGTRIFLQAPNERKYEQFAGEHELFAGAENRFYMGAYYFEFRFHRNDRGEVDRMVIVGVGATEEAKKVP